MGRGMVVSPSSAASTPQSGSAVLSGFSAALVSWTAPSSTLWPVQGYRVSVLPDDLLETFINYPGGFSKPAQLGFPLPAAWQVMVTDTALTTNTYSFDPATGSIILNAMGGAGLALTGAYTAPTSILAGPYNGLVVTRSFPAAQGAPPLDPNGDWVVETYLAMDTSTANQVAYSQVAGLCIYDAGIVRSWTGGIGTGACQIIAGLRNAGGVIQFGWETLTLATTAAAVPIPAFSATGWNNWIVAPQGTAWVRLERRGLAANTACVPVANFVCSARYGGGVGGTWRAAFKFQASGAWIYMTDVGVDTRLWNGAFSQPMSSTLRVGFAASSWVPTVTTRLYASFKFLRFAPLAACKGEGATRNVLNPNARNATLTGLTTPGTYTLQVQTIVAAGLVSPKLVLPTPVVVPAPASPVRYDLNVAALYRTGALVDVLTATPWTKTTYQVSVWSNAVATYGPQLVIDGNVNTFANAAYATGGYWLPAGPNSDRTKASSYTGTAYAGGSYVASGAVLQPSTDPLGDWWAIDFGIRTSIKNIYHAGRQSSTYMWREALVEFWIGDAPPPYWNLTQRCDPALMPVQNLTSSAQTVMDPATGILVPWSGHFMCTLTGRYLYMRSPAPAGTVANFGLSAMDGVFNTAELRFYASNQCPARTAVNGFTTTPDTCSGQNGTVPGGGSGYGQVCIHQCNAGYVAVSGSGVANCDGECAGTQASARESARERPMRIARTLCALC